MEIISIVNQKGGVGKTTTTINLGACLAELGNNVLYIDLDPQGNLTEGLGEYENDMVTSFEVLKKEVTIEEAQIPLDFPASFGQAKLIPANLRLAEAELELSGELGRETILREIWLDNYQQEAQEKYDYVLIDTNPSLGILTINAMSLTDSIIIPVEPGIFSAGGMGKLLEIAQRVKKKFNRGLKIRGILFTRVDGRTNIGEKYYDLYREKFESNVFEVFISQNVTLNEAQEAGKPINLFNKQAKGAKDYMKLAEVINNE